MANDRMPKVDMAKEFANLNESDKHFVRKLESMNLQRAQHMKISRTRSKYTGILLAVGVLSIYGYTMFAVKQEKFLDFEDVPDKSNKLS